MNNFPNHVRHQRGAVLIVALIMLLLLTIIGLSSMRGTSLQENMAGNMRDSNLALQASEAALRKGEEEVTARFIAGTLSVLETANLAGSYESFPSASKDPEYSIVLLAKIRTSTEAGAPIDDEGALVRVESDGYGSSTNADDEPSSHIQLRSTFLVEQ
ncbi:pilus assembly PilX family protein [Stutzerimonas nitrititolerans]|uniref:pilus assembly PilX family protein n=1 Tax=Stutzerimonas nitrititolerans TaxID=2482751 RepID=UPI0028ABE106|nr:PilX N-terminal domain-containing pilus assembly protein [Stutzerimonas nitrititolerans]